MHQIETPHNVYKQVQEARAAKQRCLFLGSDPFAKPWLCFLRVRPVKTNTDFERF